MKNQEIAIQKDVTPINLNITDKGIAALKEKYTGMKATTPKEQKALVAGIAVIRNLRGTVKVEKDVLSAPHKVAIEGINTEFDRVIPILLAIEAPMKIEKKRYDDAAAEKKRIADEIEAKRVAGIKKRIDAFHKNAQDLYGKNAEQLAAKIAFFKSCVAGDKFDYEEFDLKAVTTKATVLKELEAAHKTKAEQEAAAAKIAEQQAEIARQQKEIADERAKIAKQQADIKKAADDAELAKKSKLADEAFKAEALELGRKKDAEMFAGQMPKDKVVIDTEKQDAVIAENLRVVSDEEVEQFAGSMVIEKTDIDDIADDEIYGYKGDGERFKVKVYTHDAEPPVHNNPMRCTATSPVRKPLNDIIESVTIPKPEYFELKRTSELYKLVALNTCLNAKQFNSIIEDYNANRHADLQHEIDIMA